MLIFPYPYLSKLSKRWRQLYRYGKVSVGRSDIRAIRIDNKGVKLIMRFIREIEDYFGKL
jgi:hypothetical protein